MTKKIHRYTECAAERCNNVLWELDEAYLIEGKLYCKECGRAILDEKYGTHVMREDCTEEFEV